MTAEAAGAVVAAARSREVLERPLPPRGRAQMPVQRGLSHVLSPPLP